MITPVPGPEVLVLGDAVIALRDIEANRIHDRHSPKLDCTHPLFVNRLQIYVLISGQDEPAALEAIKALYAAFVAARDTALLEEDIFCAIQRAYPGYQNDRASAWKVLAERRAAATAEYKQVLTSIGRDECTAGSITDMHRHRCEHCKSARLR